MSDRTKLELACEEIEMLRSVIRDTKEALGAVWTKRMSLPEGIAAKCRMLEDTLAIAAERDRNLSNANDEMRDALLLARDALDRLMGDSDLEEDDSIEQRAMRSIARALEARDE